MAVEYDYDVIAAEVHRKAMQNVTNEMGITLVRTSGSPIVTSSMDFSMCLMDKTPEHLAFASYVLLHVGSSLIGTEAIIDAVDDSLQPGDGWIVNDPHTGGAAHQGDVSVIMPMFYGDEHLGWNFANMHVLDVGGVGVSGYAPGAHDVWQEGMRFPPVRVIRDGAIDREWEKYIQANVRTPHEVLNDMRSMVAANNTAAQKLREIIDEYGLERHREFCAINLDLTEAVIRDRILLMPDGVYEARDWQHWDGHDGPDELLEIQLRLEIAGSDMRFSYSGAPQIDAFVNSTPGAMFGNAMAGLMTLLVYGDLPVNGGLWRPITVDLGRPGTIVNSVPPAPVSNAHCEAGFRACKLAKDVICQALALSDDPVLRSRIGGQHADGFPGNALFGRNQHNGASVIFYPDSAIGSGGGAQTTHDGQDTYGMTCTTGGGIPDVENHEAADPVLFLWKQLRPNSGGPGQTRGGTALDLAYAIHYTDLMAGPGFNSLAQVPAHGFGGGLPGGASAYSKLTDTNVTELLAQGMLPTNERFRGREVPTRQHVTHMKLMQGEVFHALSGSGGGLGDPLLRDPDRVLTDIDDGYVTPEHAREVYGVVLDVDGAVDIALTEVRREEIRCDRIMRKPKRPLARRSSMAVSVERKDGAWSCASCGECLGEASSNWRDTAILSERPIKERMEELGMFVQDRVESPRVMIREHFCPGCAASLGADVATDDVEALPAASSRL
jgi:N-methylhydantoinase B